MKTKSFKIKDLSSQHQMAIRAMQDQLLIVFVNRLGGEVDIPVSEIDGTGEFGLAFKIDYEKRIFHFEVMRKDRSK